MAPREKQALNLLPIAAGALVVLIGVGAWVVDLAAGIEAQNRQQAAADAGALAASCNLLPPVDEATVKSTAQNWVGRNGYAISFDDVKIWTRPNGRQAVTVRVSQAVPTIFERFIGISQTQVNVAASATLGGVDTIPHNVLPIGLPAYQDDQKNWMVLSSETPGDYRPLSMDPAKGGPTPLVLKQNLQGNPGNFVALALDGTGGNAYHDSLVTGARSQLRVGSQVATDLDNLMASTTQGMGDRLAQGGDAQDAVIPLISRHEWEQNNGRSSVSIVGFVMVHLASVAGDGSIYANYMEKVLPDQGVLDGGSGAGGYAPVLISTPPQ